MPDPPITRRVFVDFMYAIVVGAVLPLIKPEGLKWEPALYGLGFLIVVILEDYFLYETQIARFQHPGSLSFFGLVFEIGILMCWYLAAISIPGHPRLFLATMSLFFSLKLLAGFAHWKKIRWESMRNLAFLLPVVVCAWIAECDMPKEVNGVMIAKVLISWALMVAAWWGITRRYESAS